MEFKETKATPKGLKFNARLNTLEMKGRIQSKQNIGCRIIRHYQYEDEEVLLYKWDEIRFVRDQLTELLEKEEKS